jgi:hypothetical protein
VGHRAEVDARDADPAAASEPRSERRLVWVEVHEQDLVWLDVVEHLSQRRDVAHGGTKPAAHDGQRPDGYVVASGEGGEIPGQPRPELGRHGFGQGQHEAIRSACSAPVLHQEIDVDPVVSTSVGVEDEVHVEEAPWP